MPDNEMIPVHVERELGSEGAPTGKYVFTADDLHHFYYPEFDADRMERHLDTVGYTYQEFRPMIREMERQFGELTAAPEKPAAKTSGKPPTDPPAKETE